MNDQQFGAALRGHILRAAQEGQPMDVRRMQALVSDLGEPDQAVLMPALKHLVASPTLAGALQRTPPLGDARLMAAILEEMEEIYAPAICGRMAVVTRAVFDRNDPAASPSVPAPAPIPPPAPVATPDTWVEPPLPAATRHQERIPPQAPPAPPPVPAAAPRNPGGSSALVVVLAFLAGLLLMATVGLALWLRSGQRTVPTGTASGLPPSAPAPSPAPESRQAEPAPKPPEVTEPAPTPAEPPAGAVDLAVASVQSLYAALSEKNFDAASRLLQSGTAPADQFDPDFFRQFERVSVSDLSETGSAGSTVNLEGRVTFVYPDGTIQIETRSFSVDTGVTPAQITASEFISVVKPRG